MKVYLARDISAFLMYCVYGDFCSSLFISESTLLIDSTDSMIISQTSIDINNQEGICFARQIVECHMHQVLLSSMLQLTS